MITDTRLVFFYVHRLTGRQREVLNLTAEGLHNEAIATKLYIAPSVVAQHLSNIYGELGLLEELASTTPDRLLVIRLFAPFFDRHPELRGAANPPEAPA
ncbi:MAG: helix-turn-helix transcriptional regulator [Anaerolinea sp.]|nr:helix-turn-helix transcriptional regulator [Anaerolinea sp.]